MHWQIIVALVVMIPVILIPVAVLWYLNGKSLYQPTIRLFHRRTQTKTATPLQESSREELTNYPIR